MKALVTGAAGQLGHDVMDELKKRAMKGSVWMCRKWTSQMPKKYGR